MSKNDIWYKNKKIAGSKLRINTKEMERRISFDSEVNIYYLILICNSSINKIYEILKN